MTNCCSPWRSTPSRAAIGSITYAPRRSAGHAHTAHPATADQHGRNRRTPQRRTPPTAPARPRVLEGASSLTPTAGVTYVGGGPDRDAVRRETAGPGFARCRPAAAVAGAAGVRCRCPGTPTRRHRPWTGRGRATPPAVAVSARRRPHIRAVGDCGCHERFGDCDIHGRARGRRCSRRVRGGKAADRNFRRAEAARLPEAEAARLPRRRRRAHSRTATGSAAPTCLRSRLAPRVFSVAIYR